MAKQNSDREPGVGANPKWCGANDSNRPSGEVADGLHPPDHDQRKLIVNELDRNILVEAAAGTGKTTSLVARMIRLLQEGKCTIDKLVAVTYTRKAAAELRGRFQIELE